MLPPQGLRLVKSPYSVLRQKEEQLAQVRREVEALRLVIPLLEDQEMPSVDPKRIKTGMNDLETYFPFVRNLERVRST
jgi:hypothetical protein